MAASDQGKQENPAAPSSESPLAAHLNTPIRLFIVDPLLLKQVYTALTNIGFGEVSVSKVSPQYFQAIQQLYRDLRQFEGLVLVNNPVRKVTDRNGFQFEDRSFKDFFTGVSSLGKKDNRDPNELLGKCVPVFVAPQDHDIRSRYIEELFPFGIVGAFMLSVLDYDVKWPQQAEMRTQELSSYLLEYFLQKDQKVAELKEYRSAAELRERRAKADQIQAEVEKLKEAKEYDKAIALCRQMIEILPTDPQPYLESGRLLVKKKRYPPAMQMFNDATRVAKDLPTPNQEIGNLKVAQVKDHVENSRSAGKKPDEAMLERLLSEALDNYGAALDKAKNSKALNIGDSEEHRKEAVASVAENLLTLDLAEVLGPEHPFISKVGKLALDSLKTQVRGEGELPAKYLIQFGLSELHEGNLAEAEKLFFQAAQDPEQHEAACTRLNYLGTTYRKKGESDAAIGLYDRLLKLKPPFRGVVVFNLGVAYKTKANRLSSNDPAAAKKLEREAAGSAIQALYIDPRLPQDENFYQNNIMHSTLKQAADLFKAAAKEADQCRLQPGPDQDDPATLSCLAAREKLEEMLSRGQQREALGHLFSLAQTTKTFFLQFDRFASPVIQNFAATIEPRLRDNPKPQMRTFGKVLAVLVERGKKSQSQVAMNDSEQTGNPLLDRVMHFLMQGQQDLAAKTLMQAFLVQAELVSDRLCSAHQSISNLCREINHKLGSVDFSRFPTTAN